MKYVNVLRSRLLPKYYVINIHSTNCVCNRVGGRLKKYRRTLKQQSELDNSIEFLSLNEMFLLTYGQQNSCLSSKRRDVSTLLSLPSGRSCTDVQESRIFHFCRLGEKLRLQANFNFHFGPQRDWLFTNSSILVRCEYPHLLPPIVFYHQKALSESALLLTNPIS
jgi:hypothetical protein